MLLAALASAVLACGQPTAWASDGVSLNGNGYLGPCSGAVVQSYEFDLYAVDVDKLPALTLNSKPADVMTAVMGHALNVASLRGTAKTL